MSLYNFLEYKKALTEHTRVAIEAMEDTIQEICSSTNQVLDAKLNEIYVVLEDIGEKIEILIMGALIKSSEGDRPLWSRFLFYIWDEPANLLFLCSKTRSRTDEFQDCIL